MHSEHRHYDRIHMKTNLLSHDLIDLDIHINAYIERIDDAKPFVLAQRAAKPLILLGEPTNDKGLEVMTLEVLHGSEEGHAPTFYAEEHLLLDLMDHFESVR